MRHFTNACTRILGLEARNTFERGRHCSFEYQGRLIALEICPAGIDPQKFAPAIAPPAPSLVTSSSSSAAIAAAATATPVSSSATTDAAAVAASAAASTAATAAATAATSATTAAAVAAASARAIGPEVFSEGVAVAAATLEQQQLKEEVEESLTPASGAPSHTSTGLAPPPLPILTFSSSSKGNSDYIEHDPNHYYHNANNSNKTDPSHDEDGSRLALRLAWRCQRNGGKVVVLLAAGLDWCKGLPQMLVALASFFHRNPSWRSHVTVFVVVRDVPGRADPSLRQMVRKKRRSSISIVRLQFRKGNAREEVFFFFFFSFFF